MDIFEKTSNGIVQHGPCPYCGDWNCSHDNDPANAERVVVRMKPYTGDDKRSDTEMLEERFQALLRHIDDRVKNVA
jgi:hypothetical protein